MSPYCTQLLAELRRRGEEGGFGLVRGGRFEPFPGKWDAWSRYIDQHIGEIVDELGGPRLP